MASPQKENGYTPIANELMDAIVTKLNIPGRHLRCLLCIARNTYGYSRKSVSISLALISEKTGIVRQSVSKIMQDLERWKILLVTLRGDKTRRGCPKSYKINKNYDEWDDVLSSSRVTPLVTLQGDKPVTLQGDTIPIRENKKKREGALSALAPLPRMKFERAVPLPKDFCVTEKMKAYAERKRYIASIEDLTEDFILYHKKTGKKWQDWYAAWQNWLRKDIQYHPDHAQKERIYD